MTWVLPVPAPATTRSGPSPWVTARSCSGFSPPRSASRPAGGSPPMASAGASGDEPVPDRDLLERDGLAAGARAAHGVAEVEAIRGHAAIIAGRPVTACLSDRRPAPGRAAAGDPRDAAVGAASASRSASASSSDSAASDRPRDDRLRVDPRPGPRVEAADDERRRRGVGQGQREALVAAGVLERVEPDEPDPLDRPPARSPRGSPSGPTARRRRGRPLKTLSRWASRTASRLRAVGAPGEPVEPPAGDGRAAASGR